MGMKDDFIFGLRPVIEALKEGRTVERILVKQGLQGQLYFELMRETKERNIPVQIVPVEKIEAFTRKNHQGVLALISPVEYQDIGIILPGIFESGEDPLILCLDGVSDVRNFGAIIRSASCFGAHAVIIPERGSARITADAIKTSAGALNTFPVCRVKSITKSIIYLKESGLKVICADEKHGAAASLTGLTGPLVLIMGSENRGISRELLAMADASVKIPITGSIGSLNVSVAAGILLYEISRQRSLEA